MTIEERKKQLIRVIDEFQSIDGLYNKGLERNKASIKVCLDDEALDALEQGIALVITSELADEAKKKDWKWQSISSQAQSSNAPNTIAAALESDINFFKLLAAKTIPSSFLGSTLLGNFFSRSGSRVEPALVVDESKADESKGAAPSARKTRQKRKTARIQSADKIPDEIHRLMTRYIADFQKISEKELEYKKAFKDLNVRSEHLDIDEDPIIVSLLDTFREQASKADELIRKTESKVQKEQTNISQRAQLNSELEAANKILKTINKKIFLPAQAALEARITLLTPSIDSPASADLIEQLQTDIAQAHRELAATLTRFLHEFMEIRFDDNIETDTQAHVTKLKKFIDTLISDMNKGMLMLDTNHLTELKTSLYRHLNEKSGLMDAFSSLWSGSSTLAEPLTTDKIEQLITELFPSNPAPELTLLQKTVASFSETKAQQLRISQLREQFVFTHHVIAKINQFSMQEIKQNQRIAQAHDALVNDTTTLRNRLLRLKELCFGSVYPNDSIKRELFYNVMQQVRALDDQVNTLGRDNSKYTENYGELCLIQQQPERLKQIIELQKIRLDELEVRRLIFNYKATEIDESKLELTLVRTYNAHCTSLARELAQAIQNCQDAFDATDCNDAGITAEVTELFTTCRTLADTVIETRITATDELPDTQPEIVELQSRCEEAQAELKVRFEACKTTLATRYEAELRRVDSQLRSPLPGGLAISHNNPMYDSLTASDTAARQAMNQLSTVMAGLTPLRGGELANWKAVMNQTIHQTEQAIAARNADRALASTIQARYTNPYYRLSIEYILPMLREELRQVTTRPITRNNQLVSTQINQMITAFTNLNNRYINRNLNAIGHGTEDDKMNHYKRQLEENVMNSVLRARDNNLEILSKGQVRPFWQWIRVHILKPIQALAHNPRDRHRFFTVGAARTERNIVHLGNSAMDELEKTPEELAETLNRPRRQTI